MIVLIIWKFFVKLSVFFILCQQHGNQIRYMKILINITHWVYVMISVLVMEE